MSKLFIAERILKIRKDKGFSQKKIFEISGINQGFLSEVEQNKAVPGSNFLLLFHAKLDADINWLLTGKGEPYIIKKNRGPDDNLTPGERVKKLRDFFNLTQDEFGKKLSVNHSFISRIEKNNSAMGAEFLYELNRQFNVNINWLLAGDGPMFLNAERPVTTAGAPPDPGSAGQSDTIKNEEKPELTPDEILALKAILTKPYLKSIVIMADKMSDEERNKLYAYTTEQKRISDLKRGSVPDVEDMPGKKRA